MRLARQILLTRACTLVQCSAIYVPRKETTEPPVIFICSLFVFLPQLLGPRRASSVTKLPPLSQPQQQPSGGRYGGTSLYNYRRSRRVQALVSGMV